MRRAPDPPLVSIVMPARDAADYVTTAVKSVLRQTVEDVELVVVDDGSTDATPDLLAAVRDPRLVVVRNDQRRGVGAALNQGLERAAGRFVARLDADDVSLPRRLESQLERLRAEPHVAIVGAGVLEVDARGRVGRAHFQPSTPAAVAWRALFGTPFFHPTVILDRCVLDA